MKDKNPETPIATFVRNARARMGLSQEALGDLYDNTKGNVSAWENGRHDPPVSVLVDLSKRSGVALPGLPTAITEGHQSNNGYLTLEQLDVQASCGIGSVPESETPEVVRRLDVLESWAVSSFGNKAESIKLVTAKGTSMQGTIEHNDLLFVDTNVRHFDGDGIYVIYGHDGVQAKRLQRMRNGALAIISDNKLFEPEKLEGEALNDLVICGRVLGAWSLKRFW